MDAIANDARQQHTNTISTKTKAPQQQVQQRSQPTATEIIKNIQKESVQSSNKITSKEEVEDLVQELNRAIIPMSTNIKFGVDSQDVFYVSVIESETSKVLRRFPAEQAQAILPKMQEVTGALFDIKG